MFEKILIANRGEVAARVARTCRRLGIETIGIWAEGDGEVAHLAACDSGIRIGDTPESYRNPQAVVAAAKEAGVHAVHPGYGLLADDPAFASAVESEGLIFVGPAAERFDATRDRLMVRASAHEAGVRVLPTSERPILELADALADVERLGYPVAVKEVHGIGDPNSRLIANNAAELEVLLQGFENFQEGGGLYVHRHFERARHVEVQFIYDGQVAHVLGDRECSMRRNDRRILCESPAPALDELVQAEAVRGALSDASSEIAIRLGCRGLASCQFIFDDEGTFYFAGFTPGLQVEHATTEMCSALDLVELQLRLACGESIPETVLTTEPSGCAFQARIDASSDPSTGRPFDSRVEAARWPPAPQGKVRIESGLKVGSLVSAEHDALVATVATYATTRHDALLMLDRILAEIQIRPLVTNIRLLRKALNHESFRARQYDDEFVERLGI